jgi:hypothetical protein
VARKELHPVKVKLRALSRALLLLKRAALKHLNLKKCLQAVWAWHSRI